MLGKSQWSIDSDMEFLGPWQGKGVFGPFDGKAKKYDKESQMSIRLQCVE